MTDEEKFEHDKKTADFYAKVKESSDDGLIMRALAMLILDGRTDKYALSPPESAVCFELFHRADPSFSW